MRDQHECPKLQITMKFSYGENVDDHLLRIEKTTEFYILAFELTNIGLTFTQKFNRNCYYPINTGDQLLYDVHDSFVWRRTS